MLILSPLPNLMTKLTKEDTFIDVFVILIHSKTIVTTFDTLKDQNECLLDIIFCNFSYVKLI